MEREVRTYLALGLGALALLATLSGFFATWYSIEANGSDVSYHLTNHVRSGPNGATLTESYSASDINASIRQTFQVQAIIMWVTLVFTLVAAGLLAARYYGEPEWARPAAFAALGAAVAVACIGAGLFQHNMTIAVNDATSDGSGSGGVTGFSGQLGPLSYGPSFAWFAEWATGVFALGALVVAALPARAGTPAATTVPVQSTPSATLTSQDPIEVLRMRFARGEITADEYDRARKALQE